MWSAKTYPPLQKQRFLVKSRQSTWPKERNEKLATTAVSGLRWAFPWCFSGFQTKRSPTSGEIPRSSWAAKRDSLFRMDVYRRADVTIWLFCFGQPHPKIHVSWWSLYSTTAVAFFCFCFCFSLFLEPALRAVYLRSMIVVSRWVVLLRVFVCFCWSSAARVVCLFSILHVCVMGDRMVRRGSVALVVQWRPGASEEVSVLSSTWCE